MVGTGSEHVAWSQAWHQGVILFLVLPVHPPTHVWQPQAPHYALRAGSPGPGYLGAKSAFHIPCCPPSPSPSLTTPNPALPLTPTATSMLPIFTFTSTIHLHGTIDLRGPHKTMKPRLCPDLVLVNTPVTCCIAEYESAREFSNAQMKIKPERHSRRGDARESNGERCTRFVIPAAAGVRDGAVI